MKIWIAYKRKKQKHCKLHSHTLNQNAGRHILSYGTRIAGKYHLTPTM